MITADMILTALSFLVAAVGGVWALVKIILPRYIDSRIKQSDLELQRKLEEDAFYRKLQELLVQTGVAQAKAGQTAVAEQTEQVYTLLHDDQLFIRDTLTAIIKDVIGKMDRITITTTRQNDLLTTMNITLQTLSDKVDRIGISGETGDSDFLTK